MGELIRTILLLSLLNTSVEVAGNIETVISPPSEARDDKKTRATCPEGYIMVDCRLHETSYSIADGLLLEDNSCVAWASSLGKSVKVRIL